MPRVAGSWGAWLRLWHYISSLLKLLPEYLCFSTSSSPYLGQSFVLFLRKGLRDDDTMLLLVGNSLSLGVPYKCTCEEGGAAPTLPIARTVHLSGLLCVCRENCKRCEDTGVANKAAHEKGLLKCYPLSDVLPRGHLNLSFMAFNHSSVHI